MKTQTIEADKLRMMALHLAAGKSIRATSREVQISPATITRMMAKMKLLQLSWNKMQCMDNDELEKALHPRQKQYLGIDLPLIYEKLHKDRKLTLGNAYKLFYLSQPCEKDERHYSYQRFCALYNDYCEDVTGNRPNGHQQHTILPFHYGEFIEIDFAGDLLTWYEPSGIQRTAHLFVACFRASLFTYAEAFDNERTDSWIMGITNALEYADGVPAAISFDNAKALVQKPDKDCATISCALKHLCNYFGMEPHSNPVRMPQFKSGVERACGQVEQDIIAILKAQGMVVAENLKQLNSKYILPLLQEHNAKSFTNKKLASRQKVFETKEKPCLKALPPIPYEPGHWTAATADKSYVVSVNQKRFQVKYTAAGKKVWVRTTPTRIEFYMWDKGLEQVGHYLVSEIKENTLNSKNEYLSELDRAIRGTLEDVLENFEKLGYLRPHIGKFLQLVFDRKLAKMNQFKYIKGMMGLCKHYGVKMVERVCQAADSDDLLDDYAFIREQLRKEAAMINARKKERLESVIENGIGRRVL